VRQQNKAFFSKRLGEKLAGVTKVSPKTKLFPDAEKSTWTLNSQW
jgi:hypothetical protein